MTRAVGLALGLALAALSAMADGVAEPAGYRMREFRAPVPGTLEGATVLDTAAAEALWRSGEAVFIDAMPRRRKPEGLPEGTVWRAAPRDTIPGAHWLANTGYGALSEPDARLFEATLAELADDAPGGSLVFFCERDCWMSWNAAKRAVALGHEAVHWYPDGTDGWADAGLPLESATPTDGF